MNSLQRRTVLLFLVLFSVPLFSQTAGRLETMLNEKELNWSQAAAFVLEAADVEVREASPPDPAFSFAAEQKWLPKNAVPGEAVRLNGVALLLMRSFGLNGGLFYELSKSPHHAYRELVYKNVIRGNADPDMPVSGQDLLFMVSRILSMRGE